MPLASTLPTGSKPSTPGLAPSHITRVTLPNGYRAYRPEDPSSSSSSSNATPPKQKKTVRFVKGHTTIPNIPYSQLAAPAPANHRRHHTPAPIIITTTTHHTPHYDPDSDSDFDPNTEDYTPEEEEEEEEEQEEEEESTPPLTPALARKHARRAKADRPEPDTSHTAGPAAWRKKTPRFRGSGFVQVLDSPVAEGRALAREEGLGLPSDSWRDGVRAERGRGVVVVVRSESGRERERFGMGGGDVGVGGGGDGGDGLGAWRGGEGGYVVRVVAAGGRRARWGRVRGVEVEVKEEEEVAVDDESGTLTEGSDSEDGDEYDFVHDFSLEEAEGWVPVMVAEEDQGDDWMSLTGSWIKMGDTPGDAKRREEEKVVVG